jgi:hypothetical protein
MNGFGGYERVKEIHRSGAKSVWTARRAGEGAGAGEASFAIKFLDPAAAGWDKPRPGARSRSFSSARRHRKKRRTSVTTGRR